jgi:hypothetical protein
MERQLERNELHLVYQVRNAGRDYPLAMMDRIAALSGAKRVALGQD